MNPKASRKEKALARIEARRRNFLGSGCAIAVSLMVLIVPSAYGAFAADEADVAPRSSIEASALAGRWSGNYFGYAAVREKCGGHPCTLTIDLSPCASGWCGVLVNEEGGCGGLAMAVQAGKGDETYRQFDGHLTLDPKAASYTIQATLWTEAESKKPRLGIIGDTGKEMMFMRRSFPFQAELSRTGDAACTSEKATS